MLKLRKFDMEKDYFTVADMWESWDFPALPPICLPSNGWIVENESGLVVGAVFAYMSDSAICWMEYIVVNKQASKSERAAALPMLVEAVKEWMREKKFLIIFTTTVNPILKRLYPKMGFKSAEENVAHFVYSDDVAQEQGGVEDGGS